MALTLHLIKNDVLSYEIVELEDLSGSEATIYSVLPNGDEMTLFDHFIEENQSSYQSAVKEILTRLQIIGAKTGAREQFFRVDEGKPGDGVCALYDSTGQQLRLFCIRFGKVAIILGGGGVKNVRAWQDDPKLSIEAKRMIQVSKDILQRIQSGDIKWSRNGMALEGELYITNHDEES